MLMDVLTLDEGSDKALLIVETHEDYDGIRVELSGVTNGLARLDVYAACTETP